MVVSYILDLKAARRRSRSEGDQLRVGWVTKLPYGESLNFILAGSARLMRRKPLDGFGPAGFEEAILMGGHHASA